jgi:hypothetical protein
MKKTLALLISTIILCIIAVSLIFFFIEIRKPVVTRHEINLKVGDSCNLNISDIFLKSECNWISSDPKVASVDEKGIITGQKEGNTLITCTIEKKYKKYKFLFDIKVGAANNG